VLLLVVLVIVLTATIAHQVEAQPGCGIGTSSRQNRQFDLKLSAYAGALIN
jgi:hypothetical protein